MTRRLGIVMIVALALAGTAACSSGGGSASGGGGTSAFCNEVKAQRDSNLSSDSNSSSDPAAAAAALDKLVSIAPSEIKSEMQQLQAFDALASSAATDSGKSAEFESQLNNVEAAITKITAFIKDKCGIDLNTGSNATFSSLASSIN